jgi:hypothetical protein
MSHIAQDSPMQINPPALESVLWANALWALSFNNTSALRLDHLCTLTLVQLLAHIQVTMNASVVFSCF